MLNIKKLLVKILNKLQQQPNFNVVYEDKGNISVSSSLADVGTINMPSGYKVLTVFCTYNNAEPQELVLCGARGYENYGNVKKGSTTCEYLSLTIFTNANTINVKARYSSTTSNGGVLRYYYAVFGGVIRQLLNRLHLLGGVYA